MQLGENNLYLKQTSNKVTKEVARFRVRASLADPVKPRQGALLFPADLRDGRKKGLTRFGKNGPARNLCGGPVNRPRFLYIC